jgi:hypothetical protein
MMRCEQRQLRLHETSERPLIEQRLPVSRKFFAKSLIESKRVTRLDHFCGVRLLSSFNAGIECLEAKLNATNNKSGKDDESFHGVLR